MLRPGLIIAHHDKGHWEYGDNDTLAERAKAVAQGAIPKERVFGPHGRHFFGQAGPASARSRKGWWGSISWTIASLAQLVRA